MNKHKLILWILVLFLAVQLVTAIGIRPAKTTLIFEETKDYKGTFWVVNSEMRDFSMNVYVDGEMANYVTLETTELNFRHDDDAKAVNFEVHLPDFVPPGKSTANIVVEEMLENLENNVFSAKVVLKHKVIIQGAYPDKYVIAKLNFQDIGDQFELVSEVENIGKKPIDEIKTTFYVNDKEQQAHVLETEKTTLGSKENKLLKTNLEKNYLEQGEYEVLALTTYDDQQVEVVKSLRLGMPEVEITYFDQYFIANKINEYSMDVMNKWNKEIKNVFVDVEVKKEGQKVDEFRTKSVDIDAEMVRRIRDYLNAEDKGPGIYSFEMVINFWDTIKMVQKHQTFTGQFLKENEAKNLDLSPPNLAGKATSTDNNSSTTAWIIVGILLGIILSLLLVFVIWRYLHRHDYDGGNEGAF